MARRPEHSAPPEIVSNKKFNNSIILKKFTFLVLQ